MVHYCACICGLHPHPVGPVTSSVFVPCIACGVPWIGSSKRFARTSDLVFLCNKMHNLFRGRRTFPFRWSLALTLCFLCLFALASSYISPVSVSRSFVSRDQVFTNRGCLKPWRQTGSPFCRRDMTMTSQFSTKIDALIAPAGLAVVNRLFRRVQGILESSGKTMGAVVPFLRSNWLIVGEVFVIMLAKLNPQLGATGGILRPEFTISKLAVFIIFFINGIALSISGSTSELQTAAKTNTMIQLFGYGVIPLLVKLLAPLYPDAAFRSVNVSLCAS